jgi:uncharacterized membrane protein
MKFSDKTWLLITVLICAVYISLRLWHLTDSCLWFDEIFSIHAAEHDWREMFWFIAQDLIHPPLFYVLLKIWIAVGGTSLFWLRFFPVFFSTLAIIPFILLCRQLKLSHLTTALGLMFFAVNGSLIKYAQEVRMYSLLLCFALVSLWLFVRFLNWGKGFKFLIIVNILLVYTHYFGWFVVASEVFAVLFLARQRFKPIFLMLLIAILSFVPWVIEIWEAAKINSNVNQNIGWMTKPNISAVFQFIFDLFEPIYFEQSNRDAPAIILITLPLIVLIIIAFGFFLADWKNEDSLEKRNFSLLAIFAFTPILLAFIASWIFPYSIWGTRHLIIVFAPFAILSAIAISKIKIRKLKFACVAAICLLFGAAFVLQATRTTPTYIWCAWENLAANLLKTNRAESEPAKIYVFEDLVAYHFWFTLRDSDSRFQVVKVNSVEGLTEDRAYFLPRGFDAVQTTDKFEGERFFVAFRDKKFNFSAPPLQNLVAQGYKINETQTFEAQGVKAFLVEISR